MNIIHALHQLLNQPTSHPLQAPRNAGMLQKARTGGMLQLQNTNNDDPMGQAMQNAGRGMLGGGNISPVPDNGPVAGFQPMPGYHNQAVQYAQAMQSGDYNNPMVVGPHAIDPKYFGYPADNSATPPAMHHLQRLIHGGSPQGFPGAESMYTSPNMQQPQPMQLQGPDDPGFTPLQGSRNVPNIQSRSGRTPQIRF